MLRRTVMLLGVLFFSTVSVAALQRPLPADEAFQLHAKPLNASTLQLTWTIKPGYFLYRERIHVIPGTTPTLHIGNIQFPDPQIKITPQHKTFLIYRDDLSLHIPFTTKKSGEIPLKVEFQGCSDLGFCYPPRTKTLILALNENFELREVLFEQHDTPPANIRENKPHPEQTNSKKVEKPAENMLAKIESLFSSGNVPLVMVTFLGFGLLLSFTPCILPMIPVLSGMIVGHGPAITTRKAFFLSVSYVLSMSLTYSIIGGVIALLGNNLQLQMQSPVAIGCFSLLFVALALSMFGLYDLRLPIAWQNKLARVTRHQSGGHYLHAALMGSLSILILSPCITPPLLGALSYIAQSGNLSLGLVALFCLGLGMGTPLILVGASAGRLLPKAGKWMNTIKYLFGILLLGVAIHLLSRLLVPVYTMLLWSLLLISTGVALKPFSNAQTMYEKSQQSLAIIALVYGLFILYGASAGHTNPLLPLQSIAMTSAQEKNMTKIRVTNLAQAAQQLLQAKAKHQPVMLDFTAEWCESCKILAHNTLRDPRVLNALQNIVWLEIDLTSNNQDSLELRTHFHVIAPPTFQFYNDSGEALTQLQLVGEIPVDSLVQHLNHISARSNYPPL